MQDHVGKGRKEDSSIDVAQRQKIGINGM